MPHQCKQLDTAGFQIFKVIKNRKMNKIQNKNKASKCKETVVEKSYSHLLIPLCDMPILNTNVKPLLYILQFDKHDQNLLEQGFQPDICLEKILRAVLLSKAGP